MNNENADAKRAFELNQACPYCGAVLALGVNLSVERSAAGGVIGACCADCASEETRENLKIRRDVSAFPQHYDRAD
mgnify:FL=1